MMEQADHKKMGALTIAVADPQRLLELRAQLELFERDLRVCMGVEPLYGAAPSSRAVLLDAELIHGGEQLLDIERLREAMGHNAPLIILSERADLLARLTAVELGADGFVKLPLDAAALVDRVEKAISPTKEEPMRVFIIEDDPIARELYARCVRGANIHARLFSDAESMFEALEDEVPELFILDYHLPGCTGLDVARAIRQDSAFVGVPMVFVTAETDRNVHFDTLMMGSDQVLNKPLTRAHLLKMIRARVTRFRSLRALMAFDSLTQLYNHTHFKEQLSKQLAQSVRLGSPMTLAMIDVDGFKQVNDRWGHPVGDRVLRGLSQLLKRRLRRSDIIGRYGGDEFAVIMPDTDCEGALHALDEVRTHFAELRHDSDQSNFSVTMSCGLADYPAFRTEAALTFAADKALYRAKDDGKNRVVCAGALVSE